MIYRSYNGLSDPIPANRLRLKQLLWVTRSPSPNPSIKRAGLEKELESNLTLILIQCLHSNIRYQHLVPLHYQKIHRYRRPIWPFQTSSGYDFSHQTFADGLTLYGWRREWYHHGASTDVCNSMVSLIIFEYWRSIHVCFLHVSTPNQLI